MDDDRLSTFSYDGDGQPDSFSLAELQSAVDLLASPAFPKDKLESEVATNTHSALFRKVATCKMIAAFTNIPVPRIHAWNSDASNPVGAEYMILDKIKGTPASHNWENLSEEVKKIVVSQVARYFLEIFSLRFESAGSLYLSPLSPLFLVGPIISTPFYRALDGVVRVPDAPISNNVDPNRGPFSTVTEYLSSNLRAELDFISNHRSVVLSELQECDPTQLAESRLELGERVMRKAIELCSIDTDSGRVTGFIDFEAATIAPLWDCAVIPRWLQDADDPESSYEGGTSEERGVLRAVFLSVMEGSVRYPEWREAYELGRPFRRLTDLLCFQVNVWASNDREIWVDKRLEWAKNHPGIGLPETEESEIDTQ
ncbi:hypothetical protein BD769DRAFT_1354918 [Suillus cothurnatus]|nr:hypothetical protein BD769DRAFT_1354918 [Suillus cothurnatus]